MAITYEFLFFCIIFILSAVMIPPVFLAMRIHKQIRVMDIKLDKIIEYFALSSEAMKDKRFAAYNDGLGKSRQ